MTANPLQPAPGSEPDATMPARKHQNANPLQPAPGSEPDATPSPEPAAAAPPPAPASSVAALEARIAELETALAAERDHALRKAAEFDNTRKRIVADTKRQSEAGKLGFIQQVLAVDDALELALSTPAGQATGEHVRQGVELTLNKLRQLLGEHGVVRYESLGQPFDPDRHEALSTGKRPDLPDQAVIQVVREGYSHGNHVLRHAQVIINNLD